MLEDPSTGSKATASGASGSSSAQSSSSSEAIAATGARRNAAVIASWLRRSSARCASPSALTPTVSLISPASAPRPIIAEISQAASVSARMVAPTGASDGFWRVAASR